MSPCPPLGHCSILNPIFLRPECRGHFFCQVYTPYAVQELVPFPVEFDAPLLQDACLLMLHFRGCGIIALSHAEEKGSCNQMPNVCAQM